MVRRYTAKPAPDASVTDATLDALAAGELRTLIRDMIPWLDDATHARLVNVLVEDRDELRLSTPEVSELVALAGVAAPGDAKTRNAVVEAMRKAAEKRIAGVSENKRRRQYGHATSLAMACVQVDGSPGSIRWLAAIRDKYRRYPALQHEFGKIGDQR